MKKFKTLFLFILLLHCIFIHNAYAIADFEYKNYQAVILGKITDKKIKKIGNLYITEYNLKPKKWLHKKSEVKITKNIKIKVLGADLPEAGIVIKSSSSPDYIPINKEAIFLLEKNKLKQNDVFTLSANSIIYENNSLSLSIKEIENLFDQIEEI